MAVLLGSARNGRSPAGARVGAADGSQRPGVILHNCSICAAQPLWYEPIYNTTKAALLMFSQCLSTELIKKNIRVNAINPGQILTPDWVKTAKQLTASGDGDWEIPSIRSRRKCPDPALCQAQRTGRLLRVPVLRPRLLFRGIDVILSMAE